MDRVESWKGKQRLQSSFYLACSQGNAGAKREYKHSGNSPTFIGRIMSIFLKCINAPSFANNKQPNVDQGIIPACRPRSVHLERRLKTPI